MSLLHVQFIWAVFFILVADRPVGTVTAKSAPVVDIPSLPGWGIHKLNKKNKRKKERKDNTTKLRQQDHKKVKSVVFWYSVYVYGYHKSLVKIPPVTKNADTSLAIVLIANVQPSNWSSSSMTGVLTLTAGSFPTVLFEIFLWVNLSPNWPLWLTLLVLLTPNSGLGSSR